MQRTIRMIGPLADKFGSEPIKFKTDDPRVVLKALDLSHPGFFKELQRYNDVAIIKRTGDKLTCIKPEELTWTLGKCEEVIVCAGAAGAGTEAIAAIYSAALAATGYAAAAFIITAVIVIGVTYALSAVLQSMYEAPQTDKRPDVKSTLFNGPENIASQGGRVQLIYGRFRVGSYTVNQNMRAEQSAIAAPNQIALVENTTVTENVFANDYHTTTPVLVEFVIGATTTTAGATYTDGVTGVEITCEANGDVTVTAPNNTGGVGFDVSIVATDDGHSIDQDLHIQISTKYDGGYDGIVSGDNGGGGTPTDEPPGGI